MIVHTLLDGLSVVAHSKLGVCLILEVDMMKLLAIEACYALAATRTWTDSEGTTK